MQPPANDNVVPSNIHRQAIAHFGIFVANIAIELRILERNNQDATPGRIAALLATAYPHVADDIRGNFNFIKAFVDRFDGAVNLRQGESRK